MKRLMAVVALALLLALGTVAFAAAPTAAAPITCNSSQTATNNNGTWTCVNKGGQNTGNVDPKGGNTNFAKPPA
jgi:putative hemolysin